MKSILIVLSVVALLTGCSGERTANNRLLKQEGRLYQVYLNGTRDEALQSVKKVIRLLESSDVSPESNTDRAGMLFLAYGRLYVLEERAKNDDMAQVYFVKARYWCLRQNELAGDSPSGCVAYLAKMATKEKLMKFVDAMDKGANNGKSPRYERLNSVRQPSTGQS